MAGVTGTASIKGMPRYIGRRKGARKIKGAVKKSIRRSR